MIDWLEFNKESFKLAKDKNIPILLDLGALWCYWCHRMDIDTYDDKQVSEFVSSKFIPIKVDIDSRPDIRDRYNFGGFPTTAFLDNTGKVLAGGTYFSKKEFLALANAVIESYPNQIGDEPAFLHERESDFPISDVTKELLTEINSQYDSTYGGFGFYPKFPMADVIQFLELFDDKYWPIISKTLGGMVGIFDFKEGGFFRYSVTQDWKTPHYEKMLDTNAQLISIYLMAYSKKKSEPHAQIAQGALDYVQLNLMDPAGGFYSSQDAGEEYYHGKSKVKPYIDTRIFSDVSAMMCSSFIDAAIVFDAPSYAKLAKRNLIGTFKRNKADKLYHYKEIPAYISDYAFVIKALLDLSQFLGDNKALKLVEKLILESDALWENDAYIDRQKTDEIGYLELQRKPILENAIMANNLTRLFALTKNEKYLDKQKKILAYAKTQPLNLHMAQMAYANEIAAKWTCITLIGQKDDNTKQLRKQLIKRIGPRVFFKCLDTKKDKAEIEKNQYSLENIPYVIFCTNNVCTPPLYDITEIDSKIGELNVK